MKKALLLSLLLSLGVLTGCPGPQVRSTSPEDNPQHHYLRGMEALEAKKTDVAKEKFERAIFVDERFAPAYGGMAVTVAERSKTVKEAAWKQAEVEKAYKQLELATKKAETDEERFDYYVNAIRTNTILKPKDWLRESEQMFQAAMELKVNEQKLIYYQGTEAARFFMGLAYLEGMEFQKARDKFADVMNAKREGKWHEPAEKAWKKTDKIVRAMAGITVGDVGKKIAVKESISRGDLAALLIDEMKIDKLFAGRIPVASQVNAMKPEFIPADIGENPFKDEILTLMKWKARGLEPKYDETSRAYLFMPNDVVTRGELAMILEDVLIKLTGDEKLATAYFGQDRSPFPDVKPTALYYNAVMNMTTRGIMEGELSGEFRVKDAVDGPEALLAIRVLRQRLNIY